MFERFSSDARQVVVGAQERAREFGHNYIGTEHLLLEIVTVPSENAASHVLHQLGYLPETVRASIERIVGRGNTTESSGHIPFTPRCKKVLELSLREALRLRHDHIGPEHLLLGILREGGGVAVQLLAEGGTSLDEIRSTVQAGIASSASPGGSAARRTPAADRVLALAEALAAGAPLGSHHLLEALARVDTSMAGRVLATLGVDAAGVTAQVDSIDITETSDITPDQVAAGRMRWRLDGEEATLVAADPHTVERVRQVLAQADGELSGDGPLAGPFIGLHRSLHAALDAMEAAFGSPDDPSEEPSSRRESLRDRLSRRRRP
ncbi:MAG TPA: Clp protease N-terminal domain-containing protein [Pseudonocardiaceae bacterium]